MRIYLASSWRNAEQPGLVATLRERGHEVYDFRHPPAGDHLGFSWADIDRGWQGWSITEYLSALDHPIAVAGFKSDFDARQWADAGVLLLPCGRSAHLEAGYFVGAGKPLYVVLAPAEFEAGSSYSVIELMYLMATATVASVPALLLAMGAAA